MEARPHYRKRREGDLDKKLQAGEEKRKLSKNFENGLVIYILRCSYYVSQICGAISNS
jgi:hypothetical protein